MTEITLDWDIRYEDWRDARGFKPWVTRSERWVRSQLGRWRAGHNMLTLWFRRSSNGHVHIRVWTSRQMTTAETFGFRALMMDDRIRLCIDMARHVTGGTGNVLWDTKFSKRKIGKAGPWHPWFRIRIGR